MSDNSSSTSCAVALLSECNYATSSSINATDSATTHATADLLALSTKVLARNQCNSSRNSHATSELHCTATNATHVQTTQKKAELKQLIYKVGKHYKATDAEIEEMFNDTLIYHLLETALTTFRNLAATILN